MHRACAQVGAVHACYATFTLVPCDATIGTRERAAPETRGEVDPRRDRSGRGDPDPERTRAKPKIPSRYYIF